MFKYLKVRASEMYSGKSTGNSEDYDRCTGSKIYIKFTLKLSPEAYKDQIKTHANKLIWGYYANTFEQVIPLVKNIDNIFLDEVHFVADWTKWKMLVRDKNVYVACLDMDSTGKPFECVADLLAVATHVEKPHGHCAMGNLTEFSHALVEPTDRLEEDSSGKFMPTCRQCFYRRQPQECCKQEFLRKCNERPTN